MKKLLFVLLMVLSLVISLPAQAAVETLANFTFDSEADYTNGGNAKAVVYSGSPVWKAEHEGREGVMYFDGSSGLSITKSDGSSLLTNVTDLTVSFDACYTSSSGDNHWVFLAIPSDHSQNPWWSKHVGISETNSAIRLERPLDAGSDSNALTAQGITTGAWHHIEAHFTSSGMSLYVDGDLKGTNSNANDLTSLLGSSSQILLGVGNWGNNINWYDPDFTGYIDNFKITGEKSIRAALNPFNNLGNDRPNLYGNENKTLTLKVQGSDSSLERIVFPVAEGTKITLPSEDSLRSGFTIGDTTYVLDGELENPRKLIGWYNIADGKYYSVLKGDAKNVTLTGNNDVFYGDWIASSYDFLGGNTDGLITTADTSDFIDVNVFDYSELVNVNSMIVSQSGVGSESWKIDDAVVKDWLSFSDWGTYQTEGSLGFPFNRPANSANGLMDVDEGPYEDLLTKSIIEHLFNQNSVPGKGTYVPGINNLGKGNYLFSYDPATSMYSYDCSNNAAVYQQSEKRFYVYDSAIDYISNVNQTPSHNPDFFPLNKKTDNLTQVNGVPNYWFGLNAEVDFWLPDNSGIVKDGKPVSNQVTNADGTTSDMIFNFNGDDDMWVLIDDEVVLDIGGVHAPIEGTINFSTGLVETFYYSNGSKVVYSSKTNKFTAGNHTLKIYYLERGGDLSNCKIEFNLLPEYEVKQPGIDTVKIVKKWENVPTGFKLPADLTVELYDGDNRIKTATLTQDNNWSHSFSNLTPAQSEDGYSVKEPSPGDDFLVNVIPDSEVYDIAWVFTDMAGLADGKEIVIGDSKGHVLGADLNAHDVAIDEVFNIITKIADNEAAKKALKWTVNLAEAYTGGKHFYLKNKDGKYLCIKLPTSEEQDAKPYLHLHDTAAQASIFYLNASGDLQDATTGHRLIATDNDKRFGVATNKGGNVTIESAEKATLYVKRESKTTAYSFIITNTYYDPTVPMGTLQISKTIGGNAADVDDEFTFLITLKDEKGSLVTGTFDNHEFKNGQCEVTLTGDESISITLPEGAHYTVTETDANGYELITPAGNKYEGTIKLNQTAKCPFHNEKNLYALTVSKTVTGNAADTTKAFAFTVTLTDANGKALTGKFGAHTFDEKGKAVISIAHSESFTIPDLPDGTKYTVSENSDGYIQTAPAEKEVTGTITTGENKVDFVNVRDVVRLVKVTDPIGLTVAPKVTVSGSDGSVVTAEALTANNAAKYLEIPVKPGVTYTVAETGTDIPGYAFVGSQLTAKDAEVTVSGMTFTVSKSGLTTIPVLTLTNSYAQGGLTVKKTVSGNASDENDVFTFTVTLTDKDGKAVSGTFDTHTFVDGKCSFTLKGGESENFADLPIGVTYTVTEAPALGYVQTAPTAPATGVISTEAAVVSFTNVRDVVRLVKVTDPTGLTVAPKVTVTGSDGSVVTAEALTANNAAKYLEIPVKPGVTYTVAETGTDIPGYTFVGSQLTAKDTEVTVSGMTFTVGKSGMTTIPVLTLTNSYTLDSVTVTIRKVSTGLTEGIAYPAPKVSIYAANSTAPVWTGTLTPNGSALPVKLLPGTYTVKEAIDEVEGYGFTSVLYVNDAASADKTFTLAANALNTELRLDNFYAAEFSTLTLTKTVKGESGSKTSFSFRITLTDDKGQPITERFPYTGTMDGAAPLNGVITSGSTVALRDGGSITVQLPLGVHYEVEEQEQEGYVLVSSDGEKGVIEKGGAKAAFVNKPQYTATVTKVWEGDTADVRPASVQVQLMLNGKPVGDPVTLNAANGWKHTCTGLDAKGPYTVDELTVAEGYVSAVEEGEGNTFVITNSYIVIPPTGDAAHPALCLLALAGSAALLMLLRKRKAA